MQLKFITGAIVETPGFYENLSARDNLAITTQLFHTDKKRMDEVLELVQLGDTGKKMARDFSLGMKQRVFSVFYEYQQKTMKNMLISPHKRISIISAKLIYVSVFVVMEYAIVALFNVFFAVLLGFEYTWQDIVKNSYHMILAGTATIVLIPLMMSITLVFRSFQPGMVITVGGTISNILVLNWEKSYISPWATPVDLFMISGRQSKEMNPAYPLTSICIYLVLFVVFTLVYFNRADQTA